MSLLACSATTEPGVQVEIVARGEGQGAWTFGAQGDAVSVDVLRWVIAEVELEPCSSLGGMVSHWLLPTADAHGTSSPTSSAIPTLLSATDTDSIVLADLAPPAAPYCGVRLRIGPADADTVGLSAAPWMLGTSLVLQGTFSGAAPERRNFSLITLASFDVRRSVYFEPSAEHRQVRLRLRCDPERWLQETDLANLGVGGNEDAVLSAFRAALNVDVE